MKIKVRLFATLREGREKEQIFEAKEGITIEEIIKNLGISKEDVAILLVNGRDSLFDRELVDGDILSIFPPVGGG